MGPGNPEASDTVQEGIGGGDIAGSSSLWDRSGEANCPVLSPQCPCPSGCLVSSLTAQTEFHRFDGSDEKQSVERCVYLIGPLRGELTQLRTLSLYIYIYGGIPLVHKKMDQRGLVATENSGQIGRGGWMDEIESSIEEVIDRS